METRMTPTDRAMEAAKIYAEGLGDNDWLVAHAAFLAGIAHERAQSAELVAALERRLGAGHNDTCSWALVQECPCSCGHEQIKQAIAKHRARVGGGE